MAKAIQVEVYAGAEEVADQTPEECEGASALINKMGLDGQKKFVKTDGEVIKVVPFHKMTKEEQVVYRVIFPESSDFKNYNKGPLPLRVLQAAEVAMDGGFFAELTVWHPADVRADPILVGMHAPDPRYTWSTEPYLIARWGTALESFVTLSQKARKILIARLQDKALKVKMDIDRLVGAPMDMLEPGRVQNGTTHDSVFA